MRNGPTILWILLVECNPDSNVSFNAHHAVIENATLSKYNNDVDTLYTALEKSKSDIIRNSGMYLEKMYKQFSIKDLKSGLNAEFSKYIRQNTDTWNETGDIDLYKIIRDWKRPYLNMGKDFCKPDPNDATIKALATKSVELSDKISAMKQNALHTTVGGSGGGTASHKGIIPGQATYLYGA